MGQMTYKEAKRLLTIDDFKNISKYREIINLGIDTKWNQLVSKLPADSDVDPANIYDEEIMLFQNLQYHGDLLSISLLCELFEQTLFNFFIDQNLKPSSDYYKDINKTYERYAGKAIDSNKTIKEMRDVVNAIKHGEESIKKLHSDYPNENLINPSCLKVDKNGEIVFQKSFSFHPNALPQQVLNLDGKFEQYQAEVIKFMEDLFKLEDEKPAVIPQNTENEQKENA